MSPCPRCITASTPSGVITTLHKRTSGDQDRGEGIKQDDDVCSRLAKESSEYFHNPMITTFSNLKEWRKCGRIRQQPLANFHDDLAQHAAGP